MLEVWNNDKIKNLSPMDKDQWFDVLNQGLEEDRGYDLSTPNIEEIRKSIKKDYIDYLKSCSVDPDFYAYYILRKSGGIIVSLLRIVLKNQAYYLEGLETHRDYYRQGYASSLLKQVLYDLKRKNIKEIYSFVRNHNEQSLKFHYKNGFVEKEKDPINTKFVLNIEDKLRKDLFDSWSINYNKSIIKSEEEGTYPFAGYSKIKYQILDIISKKTTAKILDMGIGTGQITSPLYDLGYEITGVDLSEKMINIAQKKLPKAIFVCDSFYNSLERLNDQYDFIIFNYSIHHLDYESQINLLIRLNKYLKYQAKILIGDVSTFNLVDMENLHLKYESIWDDEEYYPINEIYIKSKLNELYEISYNKINEVSGIFEFIKR